MKNRGLGSIGPAIIVASIVLGPGSILASSRVGTDFGYELIWVVVLAAVLMLGMTALAARLGVMFRGTPCDEIAAGAGRPLAVLVGIVLFLVVACFQFSNNIAVVAALDPYVAALELDARETRRLNIGLLVGLNLLVLAVLFGFRKLYRRVEILMKVLIGLMILGFLGNVVMAQPSVARMFAGLLPQLPESLSGHFLPSSVDGELVDPIWPVQALIGTTFSVAGAFYQAYLVREKGWTRSDLRRGLIDSIVGVAVLAFLTLTIMVTAAAVLHGQVAGEDLHSVTDVAAELQPLFGRWAELLFTVGLLAGALSSFLVNVMIGGTVMSDGLGLGGDMDRRWPKIFTAVALLIGMSVAIAALDDKPVRLIIFAQAMTVLGNPVIAGVLLWLSFRVPTPGWIRGLAAIGFLVVLVLAIRTGFRLYLAP